MPLIARIEYHRYFSPSKIVCENSIITEMKFDRAHDWRTSLQRLIVALMNSYRYSRSFICTQYLRYTLLLPINHRTFDETVWNWIITVYLYLNWKPSFLYSTGFICQSPEWIPRQLKPSDRQESLKNRKVDMFW